MALRNVILFLCLVVLAYSKSVKQTESARQELEEYIENKRPEIGQKWRLHYHVAGPVGWINDPNGFSFYKGEYHLFYQFYPYEPVWGPMHWGHVSSPDLVNWKQLPTALLPEEEECFSGSAVVDGDTLVLMYTAHIGTNIKPYFDQSQYIASSDDGIVFEKFEGNPVIPVIAPNGSADFRDPKTWKHDGVWYTVIGTKNEISVDEHRGSVWLYRSEDLINWEFLKVLGESDGTLGYMWECPDFFELDGKYVLLLSPQGMEPQGDRYKNIHQNGYIIGSFNYDTFEFIPETEFQEIDYGHDFYAAQTTDNEGKRYIVAWFSSWDVYLPEQADGWAGAMTIIRELSISNNHVNQKPVDDMVNLRDVLSFSGKFEVNSELIFDKTAEIIINGNLNKDIVLQLEGTDGGQQAWLKWDTTARTVSVDRGEGDIRRVEWNPLGSTSWRLFLDASSLELFCGDGEVVFSSRVYPDGGWKVTNLSPQELETEAYTLKRSVPV